MTAALRVEWSPKASGDLKRLLRFLYKRSPAAAQKAAAIIQRAALQLVDFPNSGRLYVSGPDNARELLVPFGRAGYSLLYEVEDNVVRITNVKHQREAAY